MIRVARKGILVFEARDSALMRMAVKFSLACDYEIEPVTLSDGQSGGYRNSAIPNFVYRWTEREVEKTINTYLPSNHHEFSYYYGYRIPLQRLAISPKLTKRLLANAFQMMLPVVKFLLPRQGNEFAFVVLKQGPLHPWLTQKEDSSIVPNMEYLKKHYRTEKYVR